MIDKSAIKKKLIERKMNEAVEDAALVTQLNKVLADTMIFYFKAHSFHWNVEGPNFNDYHAFFATVYTQTFANLDPLAEYVRQLGQYAPSSLGQLINTANLVELNGKPSGPTAMFSALKADNDNIMIGLGVCRRTAEQGGFSDIANFLDEMISAHRKLGWMLDSLLK
jgi:starvation-inducible DNA-binding protein